MPVNTDSASCKLQSFVLPPGAEYYIALQRTSHQHPIWRSIKSARLRSFYERRIMPILERTRRNQIAKLYAQDICNDYEEISCFLPKSAKNILDIGAGLGGIDVLFWRRFGPNLNLHLLDKDGTSEIYYGFEAEAAYYTSFKIMREFLNENGVKNNHIFQYDADKDRPPRADYDIIISLLSWGFHYPLEEYREFARSNMSSTGVIILDVRRDTAELEQVAASFQLPLRVIRQDQKYLRIVLGPPENCCEAPAGAEASKAAAGRDSRSVS